MLDVDIAELLDTNGLSTFDKLTGAGDVFFVKLPDNPDESVLVRDTGSYPSEEGLRILRRTVQIIVRGNGFIDTKDKSWKIYDLLDNREIEFPSGRKGMGKMTNAPFLLDQDEAGRYEFVMNLVIWTSRD